MPAAAPNLDPVHLARTVDQLPWLELERIAYAILSRLSLVTEAAGVQRREISISRTAAGSSPPTSRPACDCGCPSRRDHWTRIFHATSDRDMAAGGVADRFAGAVVRAAEDLRQATHSGQQPEGGEETPDTQGPERYDVICERWEGIPAKRAAVLESARAGHIDAAGIRRVRRRNDRHGETGEPVPPDDELMEDALRMHYSGEKLSIRDIALVLGVGKNRVHGWVRGHQETTEATPA